MLFINGDLPLSTLEQKVLSQFSNQLSYTKRHLFIQGKSLCTVLKNSALHAGRITCTARFYAVEDRAPWVYPWVNEPDGGILYEWKRSKQLTAYTGYSTMWYGFANTDVGY